MHNHRIFRHRPVLAMVNPLHVSLIRNKPERRRPETGNPRAPGQKRLCLGGTSAKVAEKQFNGRNTGGLRRGFGLRDAASVHAFSGQQMRWG